MLAVYESVGRGVLLDCIFAATVIRFYIFAISSRPDWVVKFFAMLIVFW